MLNGLGKDFKTSSLSFSSHFDEPPANEKAQKKTTDNNAKLLGALAGLASLGAGAVAIAKMSKGKQADSLEAFEPVLTSIKKLKNKRISATFKIGTKKRTVELPEFLYHFTHQDAHKEIQASGVLKKSQYKIGSGFYMVDSENLFKHYKQVLIDDENLDLFTSLVAKTGRITSDESSLGYIYQIPTEDLLRSGKLKIRAQEDYFKDKNFLKWVDRQIEERTEHFGVFSLGGIDEPKFRAKFIDYVKSLGLMSDDELAKYLSDREIKLNGQDIVEAASKKLEDTKAIEYIYDGDITLADFPSVKAKGLPFLQYFSFDDNSVNFDKFKALFEKAFD